MPVVRKVTRTFSFQACIGWQEEAARYNLQLDKTKLILHNSEGKIFFSNGDPVPRVLEFRLSGVLGRSHRGNR